MIYRIEFQDGSEKTVKADGFDVGWKSVFSFYDAPDGIASKSAKLYVPFTSVKTLEPLSEDAYRELVTAETQASMEMRRTTKDE